MDSAQDSTDHVSRMQRAYAVLKRVEVLKASPLPEQSETHGATPVVSRSGSNQSTERRAPDGASPDAPVPLAAPPAPTSAFGQPNTTSTTTARQQTPALDIQIEEPPLMMTSQVELPAQEPRQEQSHSPTQRSGHTATFTSAALLSPLKTEEDRPPRTASAPEYRKSPPPTSTPMRPQPKFAVSGSDGNADDSRRVVIHQLTPPKVTTMRREHMSSSGAPPAGFFSTQISTQANVSHSLTTSAIDGGLNSDVSLDASARRSVALLPPHERIAQRAAADVLRWHHDVGELYSGVETDRRTAADAILRSSDRYAAQGGNASREWKSLKQDQQYLGISEAYVNADLLLAGSKHRAVTPRKEANLSSSIVPQPLPEAPTPTPRYPATSSPATGRSQFTNRQSSDGIAARVATSPRSQQSTVSWYNHHKHTASDASPPPGSRRTPKSASPLLKDQRSVSATKSTSPSASAHLPRRADPNDTASRTITANRVATPRRSPHIPVSDYTRALLRDHNHKRQKALESHRIALETPKPSARGSAIHDDDGRRSQSAAVRPDANRVSPRVVHSGSFRYQTPTRKPHTAVRDEPAAVSPTRSHRLPPRVMSSHTIAPSIGEAETATAESMPLLQYVRMLSEGPTAFFMDELPRMKHLVATAPDACDVLPHHVKQWAALTSVLNQSFFITEAVMPLLIAELRDRLASVDANKASRADSDVSHIVCSIIGFGELGKAALELLFHMLHHGIGEVGLVGLAIRACGGLEGLAGLCDIAERGDDPGAQSRAFQALSVFAHAPIVGHTSVLCLGMVQMKGKKMFYQPQVAPLAPSASNTSAKPRHTLPTTRTSYRRTHVFVDAATARRQVMSLASTDAYALAYKDPSRVSQFAILRDFFDASPIACGRLRCHPSLNAHFVALGAELFGVVGADANSKLEGALLPNDLEALWRRDPMAVRQVTVSAMRALRDAKTRPHVCEQALLMLASLPQHISEPVADPLIEYTTALVDRLSSDDAASDPSAHALVNTALVAMACVLHHELHSQRLIDTATAIPLHLLRSPHPELRRAACAALGVLGPTSSNPQAVVRRVLDNLHDGYLAPESACWALARSGRQGIASLLDVASQAHISPTLRVAAVTAIDSPRVDAADEANGRSGAVGVTRAAVLRCLERLAVENLCSAAGEPLAAACVTSLVDLLTPASEDREKDAQSEPNRVCETLTDILNHSGAASGVCRTATLSRVFELLCERGAAHGMRAAASYALDPQLPVSVRSAATYGLRGSGGRCCVHLAQLLGDAVLEVRRSAADTLHSIGVHTVVRFMQTELSPAEREQVGDVLSRSMLRPVDGRGQSDIDAWFHALNESVDEAAPLLF